MYYERSATCNVEVEYSLLSGDTVYLMDGCQYSGYNDYLYPAVVGPATFQDSAPPVPKIDGEDLPKTISLIADDSSSGTAVVTFTAGAADDCDTSPVVTTNYASGHAFPVGTTTVEVTATDNQNNNSTDYLTIIVEPYPTETPTKSPSVSIVVNFITPLSIFCCVHLSDGTPSHRLGSNIM